jgi:hypothetical protein
MFVNPLYNKGNVVPFKSLLKKINNISAHRKCASINVFLIKGGGRRGIKEALLL